MTAPSGPSSAMPRSVRPLLSAMQGKPSPGGGGALMPLHLLLGLVAAMPIGDVLRSAVPRSVRPLPSAMQGKPSRGGGGAPMPLHLLLLGLVVAMPITDVLRWLVAGERGAVSYQTDFCELRAAGGGGSWVLEPWSTGSSLVGVALMLRSWHRQATVHSGDGSVRHGTWAAFCASFFCGTIYHGTGATAAVLGAYLFGSFFADALVDASLGIGLVGGRTARRLHAALWALRPLPLLARLLATTGGGGDGNGAGTGGVSVAHATLILITLFTATVTLAFVAAVHALADSAAGDGGLDPGSVDRIRRHTLWSALLGVKDSLARFEPALCDAGAGLGVAYHVFFHIAVAWSVTHMCLLVDELARTGNERKKQS